MAIFLPKIENSQQNQIVIITLPLSLPQEWSWGTWPPYCTLRSGESYMSCFWSIADILSNGIFGTNYRGIQNKIQKVSFWNIKFECVVCFCYVHSSWKHGVLFFPAFGNKQRTSLEMRWIATETHDTLSLTFISTHTQIFLRGQFENDISKIPENMNIWV